MSKYVVWYILKMDNHGYLKSHEVEAADKKEAFALTEEYAQVTFSRHAFTKSLKAPKWEGGVPGDLERRNLSYSGMVYSMASKYGKQIVLW